jgi:putative IMPACT (imprinted ancient) family translation regulator
LLCVILVEHCLGVPGLINAYKMAASLVLQTTTVIQKPIEVNYELHFDYTKMNDVMMLVKQCNCTILNQETQLFCILKMGIPKARVDETLYRLKELLTVDVLKLK